MSATTHSPLQNFKWLKIRYKYIKQLPKVVLGFLRFTRFLIAKYHLTSDNMCQTRKIYGIS